MAEYGTDQEQNNSIGEEVRNFETSGNKLEDLLDLIAEALIQNELVDTSSVEANQKFIRNGQLQPGQGSGVLALFQKDIKANADDLNTFNDTGVNLEEIANQIINFNTLIISINPGTDNSVSIVLEGGGFTGSEDITEYIVQDGTFSNVSQFIPLSQQKSNVDVDKANEYLDTNIFELLPTGDTRQSRIIRFFQELNALLPSSIPDFDLSDSMGNPNPDGRVDRTQDGTWDGSLQYQQDNSISYVQDNQDGNIDEEDAFIHRIKGGAYPANDTNQNRTIEDIYNTILPYLTDILEDPIELEDIPKYKNQSSGYLQFRNPNQGIIIRNTNQEFIEGLDPSNLTYLDTLDTDGIVVTQGTGFTITMWVRFLDKVSEGTLFNFGNPTRTDNPFGFKLETYVLDKDGDNPHTSHATWGTGVDYILERDTNYIPPFENTNTARFVRLVVNDNGTVRDSHVGTGGGSKSPIFPANDGVGSEEFRLLQTTFIPEDFQEWYFICASFNPNVDEDVSFDSGTGAGEQTDPSDIDLSHSTNYWLNHINPSNGVYTNNSGYGNRCKVEIISRTDLLRARGFKV